MTEKKGPSFALMAYRLNLAMSIDAEVVVSLRTRGAQPIVGKVTSKRIDPRKKVDPKQRNRSNLIYTVAGVEVEVERMSDVGVRGVKTA